MNVPVRSLEENLSLWVEEQFINKFSLDDVNIKIFPTNNSDFGDYQCNEALSLSKKIKLPPKKIAEQFIDSLILPNYIDRIEIAGPGFINFFLSNKALSDYLEYIENDLFLGVEQTGNGKTIILDYSSPNIAKPMHIGHIRSTVIGNALDRLHRFLGYKVIADNHLGDWGTQFGLMLIGYKEFLDQKSLDNSPIEELERIYVKSYNRSKNDENWKKKAKAELVKLQQGDEDNLNLWNKFVDLSIKEFNDIYERLDVSFDLSRGESFYNNCLQEIIDDLSSKKLLVESDGALVVDLEEEGMPVCIVQKSDGGYNYSTTDLATVKSRQKEFSPEKIIYVTDERQQLHFKQFFKVSEKLGLNTTLIHVWFGLMRLPDSTFSTREGNVIKLAHLLDEAEKRALEIIKSNKKSRSNKEDLELAKAIGIGAIKYTDLSHNPQSLITFSWEKALNLNGNSAPYLQYAYARIASVCDKYFEKYGSESFQLSKIHINHDIERKLALKLTKFGSVISEAAEQYKPNILTDYLFELSQIYSNFYQNLPFLKAEDKIRDSRIRLCSITAKILKTGLNLLGIQAPERI